MWRLTLIYVSKVGSKLGGNVAGIQNEECDKEKCLVDGGCNNNRWMYADVESWAWKYDNTIRLTCRSKYFTYVAWLCIIMS